MPENLLVSEKQAPSPTSPSESSQNHPKAFTTFTLMAWTASAILGAGLFDLPGQIAQIGTLKIGLMALWFNLLGVLALSSLMRRVSEEGDQSGGWPEVQKKFSTFWGDRIGRGLGWAYWISAWVGNLAYYELLLGQCLYHFGFAMEGMFKLFFITILILCVHWMVRKSALKLPFWGQLLGFFKISLLLLLLSLILPQCQVFALKPQSHFNLYPVHNFGHLKSNFGSLLTALMAVNWLFLGFEGTIFWGHRATQKASVRKATWGGLSLVASIYTSILIISFGAASRAELSTMAGHGSLLSLAGRHQPFWLQSLLNVGFSLFLLGALVSWTLLAAELALPAKIKKSTVAAFPENQPLPQPAQRGLNLTTAATLMGAWIGFYWGLDYQKLASLASWAVIPSYVTVLLLRLQKRRETHSPGKREFLLQLASALYLLGLISSAF